MSKDTSTCTFNSFLRVREITRTAYLFLYCTRLDEISTIPHQWLLKLKLRMEIGNVSNKLIIDTRTKFCIYARGAFSLHKTHQWRSNPKKEKKRPNKVRSWRALRTKIPKRDNNPITEQKTFKGQRKYFNIYTDGYL